MFTDQELWWWYAYDYGWCRVMLGDHRKQSTLDTEGCLYDPTLAAVAEKFWRSTIARPVGKRHANVEAQKVRDAWAQAHGCGDFVEAMEIGLRNVARRGSRAPIHPGTWKRPATEITPPIPRGHDVT